MAQIHPLPRNPTTDPVFFAKTDLRVGISLRYYGRNQTRGRLYFIRGIRTREKVNGVWYNARVLSPCRLADVVTLRCATTGDVHQLTVAYLSYSAIWRIED